MSGIRSYGWMLSVSAVLAISGCHKKPVPAPPPPAPTPIVLPKTETPKPDPTLPPAPKITTPAPSNPPVTVEVKVPPPKPVPQKKQRARATKKSTPPAAQEVKTAEVKIDPAHPEVTPGATPSGPAPPQPNAPKLGTFLTPEESRDHKKRLGEALDRARNALVIIQGKTLSKEHTEEADRIKTFVAQAEQAREADLVSAVSLAERADLLSRDLLERLR